MPYLICYNSLLNSAMTLLDEANYIIARQNKLLMYTAFGFLIPAILLNSANISSGKAFEKIVCNIIGSFHLERGSWGQHEGASVGTKC